MPLMVDDKPIGAVPRTLVDFFAKFPVLKVFQNGFTCHLKKPCRVVYFTDKLSVIHPIQLKFIVPCNVIVI